MPEDEFRTDLEWPTDPFGERRAAAPAPAEQDSLASSPNPESHDDAGDRLLERVDILRRDVDAHLADVRSDLAGIRQSLADLLARPVERASAAAPASTDGLLEPVLAELAQVRDELASLRRRISLRADAVADRSVLSDEQLTRIARTVADLLSSANDRRKP